MTVNEWLKQDRQWPRACRIGHARFMWRKAETATDRDFWLMVLEANGSAP